MRDVINIIVYDTSTAKFLLECDGVKLYRTRRERYFLFDDKFITPLDQDPEEVHPYELAAWLEVNFGLDFDEAVYRFCYFEQYIAKKKPLPECFKRKYSICIGTTLRYDRSKLQNASMNILTQIWDRFQCKSKLIQPAIVYDCDCSNDTRDWYFATNNYEDYLTANFYHQMHSK